MTTSGTFDGELLRWKGGSWFFVALPEDLADDIEAATAGQRGGFGSVRVEATIGQTTWATSVFPDSGRGTYLLPVKKPVRVAEAVDDGDVVCVTVTVVERV